MTTLARYSGTCPECDRRWQPGDQIVRAWPDNDEALWRHAVCPPDKDTPLGTHCMTCFLIHPEGTCDR